MGNLRYGKCVCLVIAGKGKQVFRNSDKEPFREDQVNNFDELVKAGAIEEVDAPKNPSLQPSAPSSRWTVDKLKAYMDENSIEYKGDETKAQLLELINPSDEEENDEE